MPSPPGGDARSPRQPKVLLAADSLDPGNGGICRVSRLIARVLEQQVVSGGIAGARAVLLGDDQPAHFDHLPVHTVRSRRAAYVARVWAGAASHTHVIYDSVSMARAHPNFWPLDRPHLVYLHGLEIWHIARPEHLRAAWRADFLIANTRHTKERGNRLHGNFDRAEVCWLATEENDPVPRTIPSGPPTVTIIGRGEGYKGHEPLIDCWPRVVAAVPDARLLVVGKGRAINEFHAIAARSPVASHIEFTGYVPESQMPDVWARTHVFAMPSRGEGFGLVYIEAMRYGVPVIASVHDAAQELNVDAQTGYNVNLDHPGELEERIIGLLRDPDHAAQLGRSGQQHWAEHFTRDAFARRFTPLLKKFLQL